MRSLLFISFFIIPVVVFTQPISAGKSEDSNVSTRVNSRIIIANRGLAPIPAFSFNSPLAMGFLSLKKGRFNYEPDFALGLNGMPWLADNWFRYTFIDGKKGKINAGLDPFLYFRDEMIFSKKTIEAQRNLTLEMAGEIKFSSRCSLKMTCWYIRGYDPGALSGQFFDLSGYISGLGISKAISVDIKPQLFYFDFTGDVDGFFAATDISIQHRQIPLSIFFQGVMPVWTGFPGNGFKWNMGLIYAF